MEWKRLKDEWPKNRTKCIICDTLGISDVAIYIYPVFQPLNRTKMPGLIQWWSPYEEPPDD